MSNRYIRQEIIEYSHEYTVIEALNSIACKYNNHHILIYDNVKKECTCEIAAKGKINSQMKYENAFEIFQNWWLIMKINWQKSKLNHSSKVTPVKSLEGDTITKTNARSERLESDFADESLKQQDGVSEYYFLSINIIIWIKYF